jgi:hypothetical protein
VPALELFRARGCGHYSAPPARVHFIDATLHLRPPLVELAPQPPLGGARDALQGQAVLDAAHGAGNGRLGAHGGALRGDGEVADVALPAGRPARRLHCDALRRAGDEHVQRREGADARDRVAYLFVGEAGCHFEVAAGCWVVRWAGEASELSCGFGCV